MPDIVEQRRGYQGIVSAGRSGGGSGLQHVRGIGQAIGARLHPSAYLKELRQMINELGRRLALTHLLFLCKIDPYRMVEGGVLETRAQSLFQLR